MPRRSTYKHYDLNEPTKKTFTVNQFRGVDYTPGQLNIDDYHAVELSNVIYKDKVNQKRSGWEQIAKVKPITYYVESNGNISEAHENTTNINGVWIIKINNREYCVAHIGKLLFYVTGIGRGKSFLNVKLTPLTYSKSKDGIKYEHVVSIELNDAKSTAFYGHERLYILDGNKYLVLRVEKQELALVEDDSETYIPTTTVGITYKDSSVDLAAPLDDVNLLTQWRKNKLVSGTYIDDGVSLRTTRFWDYELDTNVNPKKPNDINNISVTISALKEVE